MNTVIDEFIDYLRFERNYSNYTEDNYLLDLNNYESYLNSKKINYKNIEYKDIIKYTSYLKEDLGLNATSINRHLSTLRSFYNFLIYKKYIENNPFKLVRSLKSEQKLPNYMKYNEFETLVSNCDDSDLGRRNRALLEVLFATGARIGEIINIKVSDINFNLNEIKVLGKGNKERIVYFNDTCASVLHSYVDDNRLNLLNGKSSDRLFINHIGGNLTTRGVRDILDKLILKSSLNSKITPHTFRHTFATMLLNEGLDLKSVQELLGHVNLSTTSIYTHVSNERIKNVYLHTHPRNKKY